MNTDNNTLVIFKTIATFTQALGDEFSKKQRPLALYCRLINKTTIAHDVAIQKHITGFRNFCIANRDSILAKDVSTFVQNNIIYSDKVYIDMKNIFSNADTDTKGVIWSHLLTISALVDPLSKAKEVLKESMKGQNAELETNFLTKIIEKVEGHVNPDASPMEAISAIMSSGVLNDLIGGMNSGISDGSLDLGKLMGAVQSIVSSTSQKDGGSNPPKGGEDMMGMINGLMGMMGGAGGAGGAGGVPDIASMMQKMMSGGATGSPDITRPITKKPQSPATITEIKEDSETQDK